jgi:hypothetical protein
MRPAEERQRRDKERRANTARQSSRLLTQSLCSGHFTRMISKTAKNPRGSQPARVSTDHSGASSVASALGIRWGATPRGRHHTNTHSQNSSLKQDLSTLLEQGTFSFCLDRSLVRLDKPQSCRYYNFYRSWEVSTQAAVTSLT